MNPPGVELDEEQDVEPSKQHGVDAEEVTGQDALSLNSAELGPGGLGAPWAGGSWSAGLSVRIGPAPTHQVPVPAKQGLRSDEEPRSSSVGEQAYQPGQQGSVGGLQRWAADLATKDGHLVAVMPVRPGLAIGCLSGGRVISWSSAGGAAEDLARLNV